MGKRINNEEGASLGAHLIQENFEGGKVVTLKDLFSTLEYGEVNMKIVRGEIASVSVTKNYQPVKEEEPMEILYRLDNSPDNMVE